MTTANTSGRLVLDRRPVRVAQGRRDKLGGPQGHVARLHRERLAHHNAKTRDELDRDWATVVKMALIARDLLIGNPRLAELGHAEEAMGATRSWATYRAGAPGPTTRPTATSWRRPQLQLRLERIRAAHIFATENDSLNGATMLLSYLLTNRAQVFADVRTYCSPDAVERVTRHRPDGLASNGFIHPINVRRRDAGRHRRHDRRRRQACE